MGYSGDYNLYIKNVEAPDDFTLKLTFDAPRPRFFFDYVVSWADYGMLFYMAEHVWKDVQDAGHVRQL